MSIQPRLITLNEFDYKYKEVSKLVSCEWSF